MGLTSRCLPMLDLVEARRLLGLGASLVRALLILLHERSMVGPGEGPAPGEAAVACVAQDVADDAAPVSSPCSLPLDNLGKDDRKGSVWSSVAA